MKVLFRRESRLSYFFRQWNVQPTQKKKLTLGKLRGDVYEHETAEFVCTDEDQVYKQVCIVHDCKNAEIRDLRYIKVVWGWKTLAGVGVEEVWEVGFPGGTTTKSHKVSGGLTLRVFFPCQLTVLFMCERMISHILGNHASSVS